MTVGGTNASSLKASTFWTTCHSCSLQYQYPKSVKNQRVSWAHCRKPFKVIEYSAPSSKSRANPWSYEKQQVRKARHLATSTYILFALSSPKPQLLFDVKKNGLAQLPLKITGLVNHLRRASRREREHRKGTSALC